ncbi:MAG: protein kinase [Planctomycetota bacterium]
MSDPVPHDLDDLLDLGLATAFGMSGGAWASSTGAPALGDSVTHPESLADLPAKIGKYQILDILAQGGMGVVARARDEELQREVAIKFLRRSLAGNEALQQLFRDEACVMGALQHPGIVAIHDVGRTEDGRLYYVMRLVAGQSLQALLQRARQEGGGIGSHSHLLATFARVCETMAFAHDRQVVHGDLKPANIMVGDFGEVQILDWGFARAARSEIAHAVKASADPAIDAALPRVVGTPAYMAPEQARGQVEAIDARTDVFTLGGMLCEILTGEPPYRGVNRDEVFLRASRAWLDDAHARLDACSDHQDVVRLAHHCLQAEKDARPGDAGVVAAAIHGHLAAVDARARALALEAAEARARAAEERKARRATLALSAVVVTAVAGAVLAMLWYLRREDAHRLGAEERVHIATRQMEETRARARAAATDQTAAWNEVLAQARAAEQIAAAPQVSASLRGEVAALRGSVEAEAQGELREVRARALLDETRPHRGEDRTLERIDRDHTELMEVFGVDIDRDDPATVAEAIRATSMAAELSDALHHWGHLRRARKAADAPYWRRPFAAADAIDLDPWRTALRRMCCEHDLAAMRAEADAAKVAQVSGQGLAMLAECLEAGGDRDLAVRTYRMAYLRQPGDYTVAHDLAVLLGESKSPPRDEITRLFSAAAALRPRSAHALVDLAMALYENGERESAKVVIEQARQLAPGYRRVWVCLAAFAAAKDPQRALEAARELVRLAPQRVDSHLILARTLLLCGAREDALDASRVAVQVAPRSTEALSMLATVLIEQGRLEEAIATQRAAVAANADEPVAWYHLGLALDRAGVAGEAEAAYRKAIEFDPDYPEAWCNLGGVLGGRAAFAEALEAVRKGAARGAQRGAAWTYPTDRWVADLEQQSALLADLARLRGDADALAARHDLPRLARLALASGDPSQALQILETAAEATGNNLPLDALFAAAGVVGLAGAGGDAVSEAEGAHASVVARELLASVAEQTERVLGGAPAQVAMARAVAEKLLLASSLAPVRDEGLAGLSADERRAWQVAWKRLRDARDALP